MRTLCCALSAAFAVCACSSNPPAAADHDVVFSCTNGETLSVRFSPADDTAVLTRNGEKITLRQQPSGSGFSYGNGPNTIRGKGDDLTVEIGRMAPIQCKAG